MISNSVPAMTAIDLLIVAVAGYGIWRSRLVLPGTRFARTRIGLLLINFGLLAVALFYLADLATMHVLPIITSKDEAMQAMEYLHGDLSWLIILLMTISISIGFIELLVELQRREAKARQQEMELAHANRVSALGHMSATIVHEMTQPIAAARMNALAALSFLDRQPPELGRTREALGSIVGNADRGREIIGRIRAFGKKAPPRREEFAINEAVLEVVAMTHFEAAKNQVSVRTQLSEGLPPVQGDRVQLQQVVFNLIINAVEAMRDSGEKAPQLLIKTGKGGPKEIHVSVKDSGPGITTDSIEQVFDPFYTTKSGGLGMGLSVCRSIIEAHQGRLWASAAEPKGAVFAFTVPVHADNPL